MWLSLLCLLPQLIIDSNAAGFDYPDRMPSPHEIIVYNNVLYGYVTNSNGLETPIVVRLAHIGTTGAWNCIAQYDANALDVNTNRRPIVDELPDDEYLNSYTRSLCLQHTYIKIFNQVWPPMVPYWTGIFTLWGLDNIDPEIDQDVIACDHDKQCLTELARLNQFYPSFMANIIAYEITEYFKNDGWNADGSIGIDGESECTANCMPYRDITGYQPQPPKKNDQQAQKGKTCGSNDHWVPLLETDYNGFFYKHEHVTPHIGVTGKPFLFDEYKDADKPKYDYDEEAELLMERLSVLAVNDTQKVMVEFFDNKLLVRGMIGLALLRQYPDTITYENFVNYVIGISLTEHDTLLQAWNQKVVYDKIRPTTVIQRRGSELITTYGGPYQGIKTFEAKDFEPYIRVMPHSEYPSGSACLCIGYAEFVQNFVKEEFGDDELYGLTWYRGKGSSRVEYGATPSEEMLLDVYNMAELYEICSESRLWGGMHFTASIHSAKEICTGIGSKGYEYAYNLKKDSDFLGTTVPSDSDIDIEAAWLPFLKALDFLVYHFSFSALLSGNINFDPDILKLVTLIIPGVDLSDVEENIYGVLDLVMMYLGGMMDGESGSGVGTTEGPVVPPLVPKRGMADMMFKDYGIDDNGYDGRYTIGGLDVVLIFFLVAMAFLFIGLGVFIGIKLNYKTYESVEYKVEEDV